MTDVPKYGDKCMILKFF